MPIALPTKKLAVETPAGATREPTVARAIELIEAGMDVEAGRGARAQREGGAQAPRRRQGAAAGCIGFYMRAGDYHRVYRLAESHDGGALAADPRADAGRARSGRRRYPRAYAPLVDKYGAARRQPRAASCTRSCARSRASIPHDVSYADARGLLQMIPPTSAKVAAAAGEPFFPDLLYDPEMNIRLGALFIGALYAQVRRARCR